jgi:hypothetical protein
MSSEIKLNFNHPWAEHLWHNKISKEKWAEFHDKFGYEYGSWMSKETMAEAWIWILNNSPRSEKMKA